MIKYLCDRCSALVEEKRARHTLKIELFTAYDELKLPSIEELKKRNLKKEMDDILKELEKEDAKRMEKEVYSNYKFDLCKNCRDELLDQFEKGECF